MLEYFEDEEYTIKKQNRRAKRDKIEKHKELFMKVNSRGLISDVLPTIAKRANKDKKS